MHEEFLSDAVEMIAADGRSVQLVGYTISGDEANPTRTPTATPVMAAEYQYDLSEIDGSRVLATDKRFLIAGTATVDADMRLLDDDGTDYSIESIQRIKPGSNTVLYLVQARL